MRFQKFLAVLGTICFLACSQQAIAQRGKNKKDEEESIEFKNRLWYGGSLALGFSSSGNESIFQFGLAPQVGYKIIEPLSIGPRVSFVYGSYKIRGYKALSLFNIDAGAFLRFRAYKGFFLQGEASNEWYQNPAIDFNGELVRVNNTRVNPRLGIGYNFGGGNGDFGSEIMIMYNFAIANDVDTYENPVEYRFGFTWNF